MSLQERFDLLFRKYDDPWRYSTSWYERRKRDVTLASLPRQRYVSGFEPACAIGVLTLDLAPRCDRLLSCDISPVAVSKARERTSGLSNVLVERREIPAQWPEATFDLIVLSEFLCFASNDAIRQTAAKAKSCLMPDGAILMCHWRHPMQHGDIMADEVHSLFSNALQLPRVVRYEETDFLLEVWTDDGRSVAALEKEGALS
jgi:SAM-dependent methyltransferase